MRYGSKSKRQDLQGIRGLAIVSVILFHFIPSLFPNGYIGVDQFFVLSGFLMCMLVRKSSKSTRIQLISMFYIRRFKRILPLYFAILFQSIIAIFTIFPLTSIDINVESAKKALVFMSNRVKTSDEDYFQMLSQAIDIFTHTWSLSVEVQFYALVPFIYLAGAQLDTKFELPYYYILGSISYIYSIFFLTETVAFNSVAARIWQFVVGMIVYMISDSENFSINSNNIYQKLETAELTDEDKEIKEIPKINPKFKSLLIIILILGSFSPIELPSQLIRPLITILTGIVMISPGNACLLESRILTYFGDISYSLYLIHWPIYAFWKLNFSHGHIWNSSLILSFQLSLLAAVISYHFYEKWYLKQSDKLIFIICTVLFTLNMGLLYQEDVNMLTSPIPEITSRFDGLNDSYIVSYDEAEKLNKKWVAHDISLQKVAACEYADKKAIWQGYCTHKGINSTTGKYKLMTMGNSYAATHGNLFHQECAYQATRLIQVSIPACEPFHTVPRKACLSSAAGFVKYAMDEKPDYLFIFSRFLNLGDPMNATKLEDDSIFKEMKSQIKKISEAVKYKIFIMHQMARPKGKMVQKMVDAVKGHKNLTEFDIANTDIDPKMARLRYEKMVSGCPKCELFDYKPLFFNETTHTWRFYDEQQHGLSYINENLHLSPHGLELVRPVIRKLCRSLGK